jgi:lipopolysaccharide/colanic/teichoic acid biosynthesis glycosyltransferase
MEKVYAKFIKRLLDLLFSAVLLILLSPLLLVLALLVRVKLGAPVLFKQERPGRDGKVFTLRKFRTMTDAVDAEGNLLPDDVRLTSFGKALRRTSLDELPELLNIFGGSMSFVGPRPLLVRYLPRYTPEQARRHAVKPGLTGWAQVNGRNALSWEEKFAYDVYYVDHLSLGLDARIFFKTVAGVLKREGISAEGEATMAEFMGSEETAHD